MVQSQVAFSPTKYGFSFRNQKERWREKVGLSFFLGKKADRARILSRIKSQNPFKDKEVGDWGTDLSVNRMESESQLFGGYISGVQFT